MEFKSREEVFDFIKKKRYIDGGSQGECYTDNKNAYKFYFSFLDPVEDDILPEESEILAFKSVKSDMFIFPRDVMKLDSVVIGDITRYVNAINLYKLNPLNIDLNRLLRLCEIALKEIELITRQGVNCYDLIYNIMLGDRLYVVDTLDYSKRNESYKEILKDNTKQFNLSIILFLISDLFEEVISSNKYLQEMCNTKGLDISIIEFITELKKYLSELMGKEITNLGNARRLINKQKHQTFYERGIIL